MLDSLVIVGTGALACLFGARLAEAGVQVTMLGTWPEGVQALRKHGVRRVEADGAVQSWPVRATTETAECRGSRFALVLVKSWQTERAARQLADLVADDGVALTLQNGWGNRETLADALGADRVALGVTTTGATLVSPGQVRPGGEGVVSLGEHSRLQPIAAALQSAGIAIEVVGDPDVLLWKKLVVNAAINPLTALLRVPNGELLALASARTLMAAAAREAASVAGSVAAVAFDTDPVAIVEDVARRTATNRSSMLQDIERGAPTEIDAICGAIARAGEERGVDAPVNRTLWLLVRACRESGASA